MPSVTGRRLLLLALAVGTAVVLAAALGHGSESRGASASELDRSIRQAQITCDQLEAIRRAPLLLPRTGPSVLEDSDDRYRLVVPYDGPTPLFAHIERSDPSIWLRILRGLRSLRDTVTVDRHEPDTLVTLGVQDCNQ